uniref:Myb-like domain-containing protein n=1 Tax=Panagrellus redivivus TaxID=6233 RepID=A0A7E4UPM8_PANRE
MVLRWTSKEDKLLLLFEKRTKIKLFLKFGGHKWANVASMMHTKKTAEQCEDRWYELEAMRIEKLQWSREEDEKLLQLLRKMVRDFDQIAAILGRPKVQCIDRFEHFIDEAERRADFLNGDEPWRPVNAPSEVRPTQLDSLDVEEMQWLSLIRRAEDVGQSDSALRRAANRKHLSESHLSKKSKS